MTQVTSTPKIDSSLPPRPRLVLRVGFAGSQRLVPDDVLAARPWPEEAKREEEREYRERAAAERTRLEQALPAVLHTLGHRLAAIAPGMPVEAGREPKVSAFFQRKAPLLRLVTGLCEGADAVAAQALERVRISPDDGAACGPESPCLETELGGGAAF